MIKMSGKSTNGEIKYEVLEECGTISTNGDWERKLRLVAWNGRDPKYDIRDWKRNEDGTEQMRKGITLTGEELLIIKDLIAELEEK